MTLRLTILLLLCALMSCSTKPVAETPLMDSYLHTPLRDDQIPLTIERKDVDGTNYLGVYLGMIAERQRDGSVAMVSANYGTVLRWISYDEFKAVYVAKTRPEYLPTVYPK